MTKLNIAVAGAGGRMGAAIIRAVAQHNQTALASAFDRSGASVIGKDAGVHAGLEPLGIMITDDMDAALSVADAVIDFTAPGASVALAHRVAQGGPAQIIGTTGFTPEQDAEIATAAANGARIVKSGNMSLGVNLLAALVKKAAATLGEEFDIDILEMHHKMKVDAPSGTALLIGEAAAEGRAINLRENAVMAREGITGARKTGTIGFATLRGGTVIGEHSAIFAGASERLVLSHIAEDRGLFANGAIKAALWAKDQPKGLYAMADVLGLDTL